MSVFCSDGIAIGKGEDLEDEEEEKDDAKEKGLGGCFFRFVHMATLYYKTGRREMG